MFFPLFIFMPMSNLLNETSIVFPLNIIKTRTTVSMQKSGSQLTYAGPGNEGFDLLPWINNQINLGNINITNVDGQVKIQFKDEGTNLGTSGTVNEIDFVGDLVTATRVGNKVTVTINGSVGQQEIQFQNEGLDLGNPGDVETINFVGSNIDASLLGNVLTVTVSDSGSGLFEYSAGNGVRVVANQLGVTAAWSSGELTVTLPNNTILTSARVSLSDGTNVQSSADAGGASNWIRVKFDNTSGYNTSVSDMKVPSVQKCFYASGNPGLSNAYSIDIDNNPNIAVVGVGSNSITIRIWNLSIPNGAQFTFNAI